MILRQACYAACISGMSRLTVLTGIPRSPHIPVIPYSPVIPAIPDIPGSPDVLISLVIPEIPVFDKSRN